LLVKGYFTEIFYMHGIMGATNITTRKGVRRQKFSNAHFQEGENTITLRKNHAQKSSHFIRESYPRSNFHLSFGYQ